MANAVKVKFDSASYAAQYTYFSRGLDLKVGDKVVVNAAGRLSVATVSDADAEVKSATKAIIDVIDFSGFAEYERNTKRRKEIEKELERRDREVRASQRYAHLAAQDSEAAALIRELEALG